MVKSTKKFKAQHVYLVLIGLLAGCWWVGTFINQKLARLQVHELGNVTTEQAVAVDSKSFYPIWAKSAAAKQAEANEVAMNVDGVFLQKTEPKVQEAVPVVHEPDYAGMVRAGANVTSVGDNGAVINGRFFAVGTPIDNLAIQRVTGGQVIPLLKSVAPDSISVSVNGATVLLRMVPHG